MTPNSPAPVLSVRKRSGQVVDYNRQKIKQAVMLCLVNDCGRAQDDATKQLCDKVAGKVEKIVKRMTGPISVENIQDLVEQALMALGEHEAARQYILYRDAHAKMRENLAVSPELTKLVQADDKYFSTELQRFQHYNKYARLIPELGRRETLSELVTRNIDFFQWHLAKHDMPQLGTGMYKVLAQAITEGMAAPSMRLMQMAGPAAMRCNTHVYNCSYLAINALECFPEALYLSMAGVGVGFSNEGQFIQQLPQIKRQRKHTSDTYVVADDTEGWCNSVKELLYRLYDGTDLAFDYSQVRPAGARLRTKGGTASGPGPLATLHAAIRRLVLEYQGLRLPDIAVHDIMCYVGKIGQCGNVRRGAEIGLSDLNSRDMAEAKAGMFWQDPTKVQRTVANNSAVYLQKPPIEVFMREWLQLVASRSGERGIFNRGSIMTQIPERRRAVVADVAGQMGVNPCGEVLLQSNQFCNLSQAICRSDDTPATLRGKVELAAIFGTLQSTMTDFNYLRPSWKENCDREHLLGVDLGGASDCPLLRDDNPDLPRLLGSLRQTVLRVNQEWSKRLGITPSTAVTCIKPGGNSGARWNVGQSMGGWLSKYMLRYVEVGNLDPMCRFLKDQGVPHEICYRDPGTTVFIFPIVAPADSMIAGEPILDASGKIIATRTKRNALRQLENWRTFKQNWAEHSVSVTIYVAEDEWLDVAAWIYSHWDDVSGLSFLPFDGHVYPQAPFTPTTEKGYNEAVQRFPSRIAWEKLSRYEDGRDHRSSEPACSSGVCELRYAH
jgi:ribonucleoside-diphosphate reductase alpha chain